MTNDCPFQGSPCRRRRCRPCNADYMRAYQRGRRASAPAVPLLERARRRSRRHGLRCTLRRSDIHIPEKCPVLGVPLVFSGPRSGHSPSLDRIDPTAGYEAANVRVISDRANRLKSDRSVAEVERLAQTSREDLRADYAKVAVYMKREALLAGVRARASGTAAAAQEWAKIAMFLDEVFSGRRVLARQNSNIQKKE